MSKHYGVKSIFQAPTGVNEVEEREEVIVDMDSNIDFINSVNNGISSIDNLTEEDFELIKEGKRIEVDENLAHDMTEEEKEDLDNQSFIENSQIPFLEEVNDFNFIAAERDLRVERNKTRLKEVTRIRDRGSRAAYDMICDLYDYIEEDKNQTGRRIDLICTYKDVIDFLLQAIESMYMEKKIDCYLGIAIGIKFLKDLLDREIMNEEVYIELIDDIKRYINSSLKHNNMEEIEIPDTVKILKATTGVREAKNEGQLRINALIKPMKSLDEIFYRSAIIGMIQSIHDAEELSSSEVINLIEEIEYENMNSKKNVYTTLFKLKNIVKDPIIDKRIGLMTGDYLELQTWLTKEQMIEISMNIVPEIENGQIEKSLKSREKDWQEYIKGYIISIYSGSNPCIMDDFVLLSKYNTPLINAKDIKILTDMASVFKKICKASQIEINDFEII